MSVSLCMIVKNEEDNLPRCLDSVKDIVDEMIIVDTGSNDSTAVIAENYGAKVFHFPWNGNFSDARNFSFKFASCDWILIMDADDELEKDDRQAVLELTKSNEADAYFFRTISYVGDCPGLEAMHNLNIRLIKNHQGYFFSNPIHEQIYTNIKKTNPNALILNKEIRVYHYGYLNKNIIVHDKRKRNIAILEKELEQHPGYAFAQFNLGNEFFALGDYSKALEYYAQSYTKFDINQGYSSKLILKMVNCLIHLGKNDDALTMIQDGLKMYPDFTDLEFFRAFVYFSLGKYTLAIEHFNRCLHMGESPIYLNVIIGSGTYRPNFMLGEIYYLMEDYNAALGFYKKALELNRKLPSVAVKIVKALCAKKCGRKEMEKQLDELLTHSTDETRLALFDTLIRGKYYETSLFFIEKEEKLTGPMPQTTYYKALCKLFLKKYKSTFSLLSSLKSDSEFSTRALCMQVLCKILTQKYSQAENLLENSDMARDDIMLKVYTAYLTLVRTGSTVILCENENESTVYTSIIFDILNTLIALREFELFEKSLAMLNTVSDKTVLLKLAKLYYKENCYGLAYQEFLRSIKEFDVIDAEGAEMLYKLKLKGL